MVLHELAPLYLVLGCQDWASVPPPWSHPPGLLGLPQGLAHCHVGLDFVGVTLNTPCISRSTMEPS